MTKHQVRGVVAGGIYPRNRRALRRLTGPQLNLLENFYGEQFQGANLWLRRSAFSQRIGAGFIGS